MTEHSARTAAPRDVPPPRPVAPAAAAPADEGGARPGRARRRRGRRRSGRQRRPGGRAAGRRPTAAARRHRPARRRWARSPPRSAPPSGARRTPTAPRRRPAAAAGPGRSPGALLERPARRRRAAAADPRRGAAARAPTPAPRTTRSPTPSSPAPPGSPSGIGAATGGLAAAHWFAPASLLAVPLGAGRGDRPHRRGRGRADRRAARAARPARPGRRPGPRPPPTWRSWSAQRAADGSGRPGSAARRRGAARAAPAGDPAAGRNVPTAAPLLLGAALAGRGNRRATETLAERVLRDLRGRILSRVRLRPAARPTGRAGGPRLGSPPCPTSPRPSSTCRSRLTVRRGAVPALRAARRRRRGPHAHRGRRAGPAPAGRSSARGWRWRSPRATPASCTRGRGWPHRLGLSLVNAPGHHRRRLPRRDQGQPGQPRPDHAAHACAAATGSPSWSCSRWCGPASCRWRSCPPASAGRAGTARPGAPRGRPSTAIRRSRA